MQVVPGKHLPASEEAERAVLGAVLLRPDCLDLVRARLRGADFYLERHRWIFGAMVTVAEAGAAIDYLTVQAELDRKKRLDAAGGMAYLVGLDEELPDLAGLDSYIGIVRDRADRRMIIERLNAITRQAHDGASAREAIGQLEDVVLSLGAGSYAEIGSLADAYQTAIDEIEDRAAIRGLPGVPTGFTLLDYKLQGLQPGQVYIVAGRPGMGKSSLMMDMVRHATFQAEKSAVVFSLEMMRSEQVFRLFAAETGISGTTIRSGRLTKAHWSQLIDFSRKTHAGRLGIDDSSNPTLAEVAAKCRAWRSQNGGLDLVCLDYLSLMAEGTRNREAVVAQISRGMKKIAKDLYVPVVLLQQLSRKTESRSGDHRPKLSDLRESGAIEQDADVVVFVYRDEVYNEDGDNAGRAELIVAKNRHGAIGTVEVQWLPELTSFRNLAEGW